MPYRRRMLEIEDCARCRAPLWARCKNYLGHVKEACRIDVYCLRCGSQLGDCRCGGPHLRGGARYDRRGRRRQCVQGELFASG